MRLAALVALTWVVASATPLLGAAEPQPPAPLDPHLSPDTNTPQSVILSFDQAPSSTLLATIERYGTLHHVYDVIPAAHATLPGTHLETLAALDAVTRIDADEPLELHLDTSRPAVQVGPNLWNEGFEGSQATIAVVDTGIQATHPSVQGRIQQGITLTETGQALETPTSTDTDGHGTHVAAIAAGTGAQSKTTQPANNDYAGIAIQAPLVSLDISDPFTTSTAIRAFDWIHNNHETYNIHVVQNSWGRKEVGEPYDPADPSIRASNSLVLDDDLVVVFSAANKGPNPSSISLEAQNPNVLTVAATGDNGNVAEFSSRGPVLLQNGSKAPWIKPDIAAPGKQITSAAAGENGLQDSRYTQLSGTSQAAPHAAGVASLIRTERPQLSAQGVMEAIRQSARDVDERGPDPATGYGFLQGARALEFALNANGTLGTKTERYQAHGQIIAGSLADGLMEQLTTDDGAPDSRAEGEFPVRADADRLTFTFAWAPLQDGTPAPDLSLRLEGPDERTYLLPKNDQQASRTLTGPPPGTWTWSAEPASPTEVGAAAYEMNATITLQQSSLSGDTQTGFDASNPGEGLANRAQETWRQLQDEYGQGPVYAAASALLILGFSLLIGAFRSG